MMDANDIKEILINSLPLQKVSVSKSNGSNHYVIFVVSDYFLDMNLVQRQKVIYSPLMEYIADGRIHSLSMQIFTVIEWEYKRELSV